MPDQREVVCDKEVRQTEFGLEFLEEVDDARLDGDIEGEITVETPGEYGGSGAFDDKLRVDSTAGDGVTFRLVGPNGSAGGTTALESGISEFNLTFPEGSIESLPPTSSAEVDPTVATSGEPIRFSGAESTTYAGTEPLNGVRCHVLSVDDPSKVNPDMKKGDAESMIYYIDAERYVPTRLLMNTKGKGGGGPKTSSITVNMKDYQTVDGLTLPYRMEFQFNMDMSEEEKKKMAMMIQRLENMPEEESKRMKQMMGSQVDMMKQMLSGDPIVVEVKSVKVNTEIPPGVF